mmetsp:Transcript_30952/g.59647  ORF Transcript_30952/g.59647 Transcript_30952/m.59647 type:complete len:201 (-) Transcript_30952:41-643(-)
MMPTRLLLVCATSRPASIMMTGSAAAPPDAEDGMEISGNRLSLKLSAGGGFPTRSASKFRFLVACWAWPLCRIIRSTCTLSTFAFCGVALASAAAARTAAELAAAAASFLSFLYRLRPSRQPACAPASLATTPAVSGKTKLSTPITLPFLSKYETLPGESTPGGSVPLHESAIVPSLLWIASCKNSETLTFLSVKKRHSA